MALTKASQASLVEYFTACHNDSAAALNSVKEQFEAIDIAYARESLSQQVTKSGTTNAQLKARGLAQNQELPILQPLTEAALSYLDGTFLTGFPIFGVSSGRQLSQEASAMEAKIENDQLKYGWVAEFHKAFRDGLKYNLLCVNVDWEVTQAYTLESQSLKDPYARKKEVSYAGNCVKRIDLYNSFWDPRVLPNEVHNSGEYAGYHTLMPRMALDKFLDALPDSAQKANFKEARESSCPALLYETSTKLRKDITNPNDGFSWGTWLGMREEHGSTRYSNSYIVTKFYAWIRPSEHEMKDVPAKNSPQLWKFYIVNAKVIVFAERMSNAHNTLPMIFGQPYDDGLGYETKGFCELLMPMQEAASTMHNARIASLRRTISDRALYNPRMIKPQDINNPNPAHKIPVQGLLPNQSLNQAYYQIPFEDRTGPAYQQEIASLFQYATQAVGVNQAQQGNFVKGNKTREEFVTTMSNGAARQQSMAICLEDQVMRPIKEIVKTNILQYGQNDQLFSYKEQGLVDMDIGKLRQAALEFKVSDGLLPTSKIASTEEMQMALTFLSTSPQLQPQFDMAGLFADWMTGRGFGSVRDYVVQAPAQQPPGAPA